MELTIGANWPAAVIACAHEMQASRARMWSFEVKLDRSNAREAFFQAVSNSSWANFGYLVTARIQGDGTLDELRVLGALHGIGLIRLDTKNPSESEILVPARERPEVDWASLARLAEASTDVWKFVQAVITSVSAKKPIKEDFDYRGD
ncbi:MAG: hypothetical protein NZ555_06925 [Geminicoccaceae bacterium]|nr:hypothetical protein [Geminicoccaceae bacterium]